MRHQQMRRKRSCRRVYLHEEEGAACCCPSRACIFAAFLRATLGAGDALGTWALLEDEPRLMKAQAQEDCRLLRINRSDFDEALEEHPEIARTLIRSLLRKVRSLADTQEAQ